MGQYFDVVVIPLHSTIRGWGNILQPIKIKGNFFDWIRRGKKNQWASVKVPFISPI